MLRDWKKMGDKQQLTITTLSESVERLEQELAKESLV